MMRLIVDTRDGFASREHPFADELQRAQDFVEVFLQFVKENDVGNDLIDEIELPLPRRFLERAFCIVIAAERQPDVRTLLMKAGISLAQYRSGLGHRLRLRPCLLDGRPEPIRSQLNTRVIGRTLSAVADDRIRLADRYMQAVVRSYN